MNGFQLILAGVAGLGLALSPYAAGCTSAVVSGRASLDGRTLLWKHRDSGFKDNFVDKVEATDSTLAYVALFNAGDDDLAEAWIGFNEAGFAVMNTASYNLAPDTAAVKDREGVVMSRALARCRTVEDFIGILDREMEGGRSAGIQANFGVTDANGNCAYVEAADHSYKVYPIEENGRGWMVRSNYSYSGTTGKRLGEVRHDNAVHLIEENIADGLAPEVFTEELSRSFYHAGKDADMMQAGYRTLTDRGEYIPRRSSCASVVVEGAVGNEDPARATVMWVAIGSPMLSVAFPVTLDDIPAGLRRDPATGRSPLCDEANRRRDRAFPRKGKDGKWIIDMEYMRRTIPQMKREAAAVYGSFRRK